MLVQEDVSSSFDNSFLESSLDKVDGETTKKAAEEIGVEIKGRNEVLTSKTKLYLKAFIPMIFIFLVAILMAISIKFIVGVDKFVEFAKNYVKLMLF